MSEKIPSLKKYDVCFSVYKNGLWCTMRHANEIDTYMIKIKKIIFFFYSKQFSANILFFLKIQHIFYQFLQNIGILNIMTNSGNVMLCQILICIPTKDHVRDFKISRKNPHCLSKKLFQNQYKIYVLILQPKWPKQGFNLHFLDLTLCRWNHFKYFCNFASKPYKSINLTYLYVAMEIII